MKKFYTLITLTGVYDLDDFAYEKFYTLHNGFVKEKKTALEKKTVFYEEPEAMLEKFKAYNSEIAKTSDAVMVTEHILKGPDLCPGFSEDEEMSRLVAPLSSESMDLAIEICKRRFRKRKENKNGKNL